MIDPAFLGSWEFARAAKKRDKIKKYEKIHAEVGRMKSWICTKQEDMQIEIKPATGYNKY